MESQRELDMTKETVCGIALEYKMARWLSLNGTTMDMETQDVRGSINLSKEIIKGTKGIILDKMDEVGLFP